MTAKQPVLDVVSAAEAQRILNLDARATVIRWGREGRIKISYQMPGKHGAFLFDRKSVERLAAELERAAS